MKINLNYFWIIVFVNVVTIRTDVFSTFAVAFPNAGFNQLLMVSRQVVSSTPTSSGSITTSIENENDDVEVYQSTLWYDGEYNHGDLYFGAHNGDPVWGAFRFRIPTAIPAGANITSAVFSMYGIGEYYWQADSYLIILANDASNASQVNGIDDVPGGANNNYFTSAPGLTSGGASVSVRWPSSGGLNWDMSETVPNISSDLSSIIQFLVNKYGGLSAGSYVQLWIYTDYVRSDGPEVSGRDYGHPTTPAPMLSINWQK